MNGFHVNAVGWVLTLNAHAVTRDEARELCGLWDSLLRLRRQDFSGFLDRILFSRSTPLSERTREALGTLLSRMATLHPERFSEDALRQHRDRWWLQAAFSLFLGVLALKLLPMNWPLAREVLQALFLTGFALLIPATTLWRAAQAAKSVNWDERAKSQRSCAHISHCLHR